jgi:L-lactate dehydrogenase
MALGWRGARQEIVLIDKYPEIAAAQAADIADSPSIDPTNIVRKGTLRDCADADIIIIAIGKAREPGQTRLDLLGDSVRMLAELTRDLRGTGIRGIVIVITNPVDIAADCVRRALELPRKRVFGTGTLLDTARLTRILAEETGTERGEIDAVVLGEHGDSSMIPFSQLKICGMPFDSFGLDRAKILRRTQLTGMDIINGKGSTEFGIGASVAELVQAILEEDRILPLSVVLRGEYGQKDIHCGVPCRVGKSGITEIVELALTAEERALFDASCEVIRNHTELAKTII